MLRELYAEELSVVSGGYSEDGDGGAPPKKDKRVDPDSSGGGSGSGDGPGSSTPGWRPGATVPPTTTTSGSSVPVGGGVTVSPTTINPPYSPPAHGIGVRIPIGK